MGFMTREIPKKVLLVVRIIGGCILTLSVWLLLRGSFSVITFVLMTAIGIAVGYAFHNWAEHVKEKYRGDYKTEKGKMG
jgi:multisubunit Na+/H+ antiporter MnhE subunit